MTGKRLDLDLDKLIDLYLSGQTVEEVATHLGVSRPTVIRRLRGAEVPIRSYSEGATGRYQKTTHADRLRLTQAAHDAARGREKTHAEQIQRARSREARPPAMSIPESQFATWLDERGVAYRREVAVDKYNVDFALGSLAVEILGGEWHGTRKKAVAHGQRTPHILGAGWMLLFVWATANVPLTAGVADYAVTLAEQVRSDPTLLGEYRVLSGEAHLLARGRTEDYERSGIPAARRRTNARR